MTSTRTTGATSRLFAAAIAVASAIPAAAQTVPVAYASLTGDAVKGEKIFVQCKTCHVVTKGVNRIGPSLAGIVGAHASMVSGYKYSAANIKSKLVWTPEVLFKYLEAPQKLVPGTKMAFAGLKKPQDRADIIAYLKKQG